MSSSGLDLVMPTWLETVPGLFFGAVPLIACVAIAARNGGPIWLAALLGWILGWIGLALVAVYYYAPRPVAAEVEADEAETRLRTLNRLLAEGLIDHVEYEQKRQEVLARL